MSTDNKKKSVVAEAINGVDDIMAALKEESKNTIQMLLKESVRETIAEMINEEDEDEYEVSDEDSTETSDIDNSEETQEPEVVGGDESNDEVTDETGDESDTEDSSEEDGDEWSNFDEYKVDDNTWDLTGEKDNEKVAKVYKLLKDTDKVVITKKGENIELKDNETGAEYMIELGGDDTPENNEPTDDVAVDTMEEGNDNETSFDNDFEEPDDTLYRDDDNEVRSGMAEGKTSKKVMKENKNILFEIDLGYTDNYQDKDPVEGLSMSEPSKSGKQIDKGLPSGTEKPWAGETKSKGDPYEKTVNEEEMPEVEEEPIDEDVTRYGAHTSATGIKHEPKNPNSKRQARNKETAEGRETGTGDNPYKSVNESLAKMKKQNKVLKEAIVKIRKCLEESYVVNASLGQIVKLLYENATSQAEKADIINRFNEAKTVEQSKALYESISRELKKTNASSTMIQESTMTVGENKSIIKESTYKSQDQLNMIDLMKRMGM